MSSFNWVRCLESLWRSRKGTTYRKDSLDFKPNVLKLEDRLAPADLGMNGVNPLTTYARGGDYVPVQLSMSNNDWMVVPNAQVNISANGYYLQTDYRGYVAPWAWTNWVTYVRIPTWMSGPVSLTATANAYGVWDYNGWNNSRTSSTIWVSPSSQSDLMPTYLNAPNQVLPGATPTLNFGIVNNGNSPTSSFAVSIVASTDAIINSSDTVLSTFWMGGIGAWSAANYSTTVSLPYPMFGKIYFGIRCDVYNNVSETNEANQSLAASPTTISVPQTSSPPLYKQTDSRWAYEVMGPGGGYLKDFGCAVTSLAMALAGKGITINGQTADPKNLNQWLINNGGYSYGGYLNWSAVVGLLSNRITNHTLYGGGTSLSAATLRSNLDSGKVVIAKIRLSNGSDHWILLTGHNGGTTFYTNDPSQAVSSRNYSQFLSYSVYSIS